MRVMAVEKEAGGPKVRPFDLHRAGTIFSEGAGAVLLESADHARARGAEPLAVVAGAGSNNNAFHMTHADKDGRATAEAILMALADAGISPDAVDHVNAHGTGTKLNDAIEARSLETVFGERVRRMPVNSIKGGLGHAMGAASSLEAIVCVLTLREGLIPPTVNYETPDPECNLDVVAGGPRKADVRTVVNNSAGIGGCNATVVFTKAN
jgi:3-oxoacyl-[acyl-carrier-protein] synthase II